jgi:Protein of unknown function (DUF2934)/HNH endonuclease
VSDETVLFYPYKPFIKLVLGGAKQPRRCRFCDRTKQDGATFRKKAHVLPQALGNRLLVSAEECDTCNSPLGSNVETALCRFLSPYRIAGGFGRRFKEKYHAHGGFIEVDPGAGKTNISFERNDPSRRITVTGDGAIHVSYLPQPFDFEDVARALARIVLFAAYDEDLAALAPQFDWLRKRAEWPEASFYVRPLEPRYNLAMFLRRHGGRARYSVLLGCGDVEITMVIDNDDKDPEQFKADMEHEGWERFSKASNNGPAWAHFTIPPNQPPLGPPPSADQTRAAAYELWEQNGRPAGNALEDWLLAERMLRVGWARGESFK